MHVEKFEKFNANIIDSLPLICRSPVWTFHDLCTTITGSLEETPAKTCSVAPRPTPALRFRHGYPEMHGKKD